MEARAGPTGVGSCVKVLTRRWAGKRSVAGPGRALSSVLAFSGFGMGITTRMRHESSNSILNHIIPYHIISSSVKLARFSSIEVHSRIQARHIAHRARVR
jgi:hypothetical protein